MNPFDDYDKLEEKAEGRLRKAGAWLKRHWYVGLFAGIVLIGILAAHGS